MGRSPMLLMFLFAALAMTGAAMHRDGPVKEASGIADANSTPEEALGPPPPVSTTFAVVGVLALIGMVSVLVIWGRTRRR